ncbi:hypothetical protein PILCRDRAFT_57320 [Piloderma croceum F 1598]|uniref:Uncharacterized protein n=1 Tax=Piloderma croceum (strain F 1598) TaxID=765440 RepID=A0A0C3C0B2_PILCF|nr:hypothetical protein PILCRDRAFT_57320 [Piloderma croceum F 1598]
MSLTTQVTFCASISILVAYLSSFKVTANPIGAELPIAVGNGFVDLAALTTLIGSSTAESLALGDRGFGGLAWAATSAFGASSVIKACIAGACTSWLREILGVRNAVSDLNLGMSLRLEAEYSRDEKARKDLGEVKAITCKNERTSRNIRRDVYAFDRSTFAMIETVPAIKPGDPLTVFTFTDYDSTHLALQESDNNNSRQDWIAIVLSLPKVVELYVLWREGARTLSWVSCFVWLYFLIAALALQLSEAVRQHVSDSRDGGLDIITGHLPSTKRAGGERKVILGASDNRRLSITQRIIWGVGCVTCMIWLIATYVLLGQAQTKIVLIWGGFQTFWLLARLLFHHIADAKYPVAHHIIPTATAWDDLDKSMKDRVLDLTLALAQYQIYIHPRGPNCYKEELLTAPLLRDVFSKALHRLQPELPLGGFSINDGAVDVTIVAVVGDPILACAAWMHGSVLSGIDLYDCCIMLVHTQASLAAVPSARVLASTPLFLAKKHDVEHAHTPQFSPKISPNSGRDIAWWYWIPCANGLWLQVHSDQLRCVGRRKAEVMSHAQVTEKLRAGDLNVSLSKVEDLELTVGLSVQAGQMLMRFF